MDFEKVIRERKATRSFSDKQVDKESLDKILDFPCNQFGSQVPGTEDEIHEFCSLKYNTSFDQNTKIDVNGENELPLYTYLKKKLLKILLMV